jgi:hypothetical protein
MVNKFIVLYLSVAPVAGLAQLAGVGESAPLRGAASNPGGGAVQQVLARVDPEAAGSLSELQAAEIEKFLEELAHDLVSGELHLDKTPDKRIAPEFQGTPLNPATEELSHSKSGLETFRGTPQTERSVTSESLGSEFEAFLSSYRSIDWAKFKIVSIEPQGENAARTSVRFQLAGVTKDGYRQQIRTQWHCEWKKPAEGQWLLAGVQTGPSERSRSKAAVFTDISEAALGGNASFHEQLKFGTEVWRTRMDAASGMDVYGQQGLAVGDYDRDGLEDFYLTQSGGLPNRLFRNLGNGQFADVSAEAGLDALDGSSAAFFADIDNNGTQDLVVILSTGQPILFLNGGLGKFQFSREGFPLGVKPGAVGGCLGDYDRDGFLDLYVTAYLWPNAASQLPRPYYDATNGPPNVLYRNLGNGSFQDVTAEAGLNENNNRFSHSCTWGDYDQDGQPDLFVANDFGRKNLYRNQGDGVFRDVTAEAGIEDAGAGMSVALGDYDGDGWEDVYFGNMWSSAGRRVTTQREFKSDSPEAPKDIYRRHARGNSLFRNERAHNFEDVTIASGVEMGRWAWCSDFVDFDNDGHLDLYIVNGFVTGTEAEAPDL